MRRCDYLIVIFTYLICCGFNINPAVAASYGKVPFSLKVAQADTSDTNSSLELGLGSSGQDVKLLQIQLKKLGYYNSIPDGQFGETTRNAVIQFQQKKGLPVDGIAGNQTKELIKTETLKQTDVLPKSTLKPVPEENSDSDKSSKSNKEKPPEQNWMKLGLMFMGILAATGTLFYVLQWLKYSKRNNSDAYLDDDTLISRPPQNHVTDNNQDQKYLPGDSFEEEPSTIASPPLMLPAETTSRIVKKVNVVDELIQDLENSNPIERRKAIWELGQKGDSRAIQPLIEQMIDADSQQRSLILAALSEIGTRTLKPMNRALAVSLQDESPDVRKNAIRDLTRVYDIMAQISQMLSVATEDEDPEVQQTARYAISQMNRIQVLPSEEPETQVQHSQEWEKNSE